MSEQQNKVSPEAYSIHIPKDARRLRCVKCERKQSSNGNWMMNQTFEVFAANPVKDGEAIVDINGLQFFHTQMLMAADWCKKNVNLQRNSLGLPPLKMEEIESFTDTASYVGREGAATCWSQLEPQVNDVTGEPIINPNTGKPMTKVVRKIGEWCGRE